MTQTLFGLLEPDWIACLPKLLHVALCLHRRPVLRVREPLLGEFDELTGLVQISGALVIDRKTGVILREVKQKSLEIGAWRCATFLDDRYILLIGDKAFALYNGLPSS